MQIKSCHYSMETFQPPWQKKAPIKKLWKEGTALSRPQKNAGWKCCNCCLLCPMKAFLLKSRLQSWIHSAIPNSWHNITCCPCIGVFITTNFNSPMCLTNWMLKPKKTHNAELKFQPNFEEIDHRLSCGWSVEIEGSGQRKRYLRSLKAEQTN